MSEARRDPSRWPAIPVADWLDTRDTFLQAAATTANWDRASLDRDDGDVSHG